MSAPNASDQDAHRRPGRLRVLAIDDEPAIGTLVARVLGRRHDVDTTTDAREALAWIDEGRRFDLILCDLSMPALSGPEFFAAVSARHPAQAEAVVFLTGGAFTDSTRRFLEEVPNERLDKPFDITALTALAEARAGAG